MQRSRSGIKYDLERCGINFIEDAQHDYDGYLGNFYFKESGRGYYIVNGKVPLRVAKILYDNKIGSTDIRAKGNCLCPSPESQADYYDNDGKILVSKKSLEEFKTYADRERSDWDFFRKEHLLGLLSNMRDINEVAESDRIGFVDLYHIDSELGLYIFVEHLSRRRSLIKTVTMAFCNCCNTPKINSIPSQVTFFVVK